MEQTKIDERGMNPIMKFFEYEHLPDHLQVISRPFSNIAHEMEARLPNSAEKSAGLRKILEAKDCMVRAALPNDTRVRFGKFLIAKEAMDEIERCKQNQRKDQAIRILKSQNVVESHDAPDAAEKLINQYWGE